MGHHPRTRTRTRTRKLHTQAAQRTEVVGVPAPRPQARGARPALVAWIRPENEFVHVRDALEEEARAWPQEPTVTRGERAGAGGPTTAPRPRCSPARIAPTISVVDMRSDGAACVLMYRTGRETPYTQMIWNTQKPRKFCAAGDRHSVCNPPLSVEAFVELVGQEKAGHGTGGACGQVCRWATHPELLSHAVEPGILAPLHNPNEEEQGELRPTGAHDRGGHQPAGRYTGRVGSRAHHQRQQRQQHKVRGAGEVRNLLRGGSMVRACVGTGGGRGTASDTTLSNLQYAATENADSCSPTLRAQACAV